MISSRPKHGHLVKGIRSGTSHVSNADCTATRGIWALSVQILLGIMVER